MDEPSADGLDRSLRFPCSCASGAPVADDPWVPIVKQGKLNDGTRERILNRVARQPRTISQLAQELGLSAPSIHRQVTEMLASELIGEVSVEPDNRRSPVERYYGPNFPIVRASDRDALQPFLEDLANAIATSFRDRLPALAEAVRGVDAPDASKDAGTLLHFMYIAAARLAREQLEVDGVLPGWPEHSDGSRWIWWAEEEIIPPAVEVSPHPPSAT